MRREGLWKKKEGGLDEEKEVSKSPTDGGRTASKKAWRPPKKGLQTAERGTSPNGLVVCEFTKRKVIEKRKPRKK